MIDLRLLAEFDAAGPPFVARLRVPADGHCRPERQEAVVVRSLDRDGVCECVSPWGSFKLHADADDQLDGDVVLCVPSRGRVERLFRRGSLHNTLLLTERCDQICVMCSQPPRNTNDDWRLPLYEEALLLADEAAVIGISGGEPTLYKDALIDMLVRVSDQRSDLSYHILSNAQHFTTDDISRLKNLHERVSIVWGVPLYSHHPRTHDKVVGKAGAFDVLMRNLLLLGSTNARIELRTVLTALNVFDLPHLAQFIANNLPFIGDWAIMGMEPIGYARAQWDKLFFDHSLFPQPITKAIEISALNQFPIHLYNIPRCTIPEHYRRYCVDSISDWKKKFLPECEVCDEKTICSGFFEWYNDKTAWAGVAPINATGESNVT